MKKENIRHKKLVFLFLFCLASLHLGAQHKELMKSYDSLLQVATKSLFVNPVRADSALQAAEVIIKAFGIEKYPNAWIQFLHRRAAEAFSRADLSALQKCVADCYESTKKFRSQVGSKFDSINSETLFFQALYYYGIGKYDEALLNFGQVEEYVKRQPSFKNNCNRLFSVTQYQASIFKIKGEPESAVNQYKAGIQYYDCYRDKNTCANYILLFRNVAVVYRDVGDQALARRYFSLAKQNVEQCIESSDYRVKNHSLIFYQDYAEFFARLGMLDSARYFYTKGIPLLKDYPSYTFRINYGLALIAQQEGRFEEAVRLFNKTLGAFHKMNDRHNPWLTRTLVSIANLYRQNNDLQKSLLYIQQALNSQLVRKISMEDYSINPSLESVLSKREILFTLHQKANVLYEIYESTGSDSHLTKARETNLLAIQLLDSMRNDFSLEKDKVVLGEETIPIYETSLRISSTLFDKTNDFRFQDEFLSLMDKARSAVLFDHLKLVSNFSGMPSALIEKERQLKVSLALAEQNLFKAEVDGQETSKLRQDLTDIKKAYSELNHEIKVKHPRYYNLKIQNTALAVKVIQQKFLKPSEAVIEYFVGDSTAYVATITPTKAWIRVLKIDSLDTTISTVRNLIVDSKSSNASVSRNLLNLKLNGLYNQFVAPAMAGIDTTTSSLIIIPQGALAYLPFEILPVNREKCMIDRFSISYAPSLSLLIQPRPERSAIGLFAGFNADYKNTTLPILSGSLAELKSIQEVLGSNANVFVNATADDFRRQADQFNILHLAVHSFINEDKPLFSRLAFSNSSGDVSNDITANELYAMDLQANMAVLSACETGIGQLRKGEGPMSLSRAFMYAGVPSTVMSLWKVPDNATSLLLVKFYHFLKQGFPKDQALRMAKIEFRNEYPTMSHPFFWAGFVINGTTDPLKFHQAWYRQYVLMAVAFLAMFALAWIMYRRNQLARKSDVWN